jgi:lysyl-tRNA synthetase class 2
VRHLPEFTLLEWYCAGMDYRGMMAQTERLVLHAAEALGCGAVIAAGGRPVDLTPPWPRLAVAQAFQAATGTTVERALADGRFDEGMALAVEPALDPTRPVFLVDYPAACGALARLKPDDPTRAERFELFIGGLELCNAFSELTDPAEQRRRFLAEGAARTRDGRPPYPLPEPFLRDLAAMPPAAGNALGVDRLAMLLLGAERIDEVVAFTPEEL